jgi:hypothetical protein
MAINSIFKLIITYMESLKFELTSLTSNNSKTLYLKTPNFTTSPNKNCILQVRL